MAGRDPHGILPDWLMEYGVEPLAYGFDQGMNDLAGSGGVLTPVIGQQWETSPEIREPEGLIPQIISELPRAGIGSGGLAFAGTVPRMMLGGALAGYVRSPEMETFEKSKDPPTEEEVRRAQAFIGGGFAGVAGAIPHLIARGIIGPGFRRWLESIKKNHPEMYKRIQDYTEWSAEYTGDPFTAQSAEKVGTLRKTTTYRGQSMDYDNFAAMKEGDVWEPKRVYSTSEDPDVADMFTYGFDEGDQPVMMTFNLKNGRKIEHASHIPYEQEVLVTPGSKFKIKKIHRRPDGTVRAVELEEIGPTQNPIWRYENAETAKNVAGKVSARASSSQGEDYRSKKK